MSASPSSDGALRDACVLGEWSRLLFATLAAAGVVDVWVSPGSRSTPFIWAAAHTPGMTVRSVIDERAAAFVALGHARITGRPSALLCTSGSAAANYFPAVVEASLSHLPLILLTADRPLHVQHAGAAQTIDQIKLYGEYARSFFDLGLPDAATAALVGMRRAVTQAVAESRGPRPGPVHLNLRAQKPLEPAAPESDAERALAAQVNELIARPIARHAPVPLLANEAVLAAARTLSEAGSGAIVVGPLPAFAKNLAEPLAELSRLTGFPILAEASSQVRFALPSPSFSAPLFDWLLSSPRVAERLEPEVLLCVGQTPTSSAFERWAARVPKRLVIAAHDYPDAIGSAELVASGELSQGLAALAQQLTRSQMKPRSSAFSEMLRHFHQACETRVREALAVATAELTEGLAVKSVVESLPAGAVLALGNSLPIRDVDAYVSAAARVVVSAQRGANGIDGLISGAIGSAIGSAAPTLLLVGDVSFLHDVGGLANLGLLSAPFVVAVVDNAGGRIFDQLPVQKLYAAEPDAGRLWLTPPLAELSHAAALFGLDYQAPSTPESIRSATLGAMSRRQPTLLHLRVGPSSAAQLRQRVLDQLSAELAPARG